MAALDLTFEVENEQEVFSPGDEVTGTLFVTTEKKVKCKRLTVALMWETHGKGNVHEEEVETLDLFEGEFSAHAEKGFPFSFTLPPGPFSYAGNYVSVQWGLRAVCDVPWARDPKEFHPLFLEPSDDMEVDDSIHELAEEHATPTAGGDGAIKMMAMLSVALGLLGIAMIASGGFENPSIIGIFLCVASFFIGKEPVRRFLAERRLGDLHCKLMPTVFAPGDAFTCELQFTPSKDTNILKATATLCCYEEATEGGGSSTETHTFNIHEEVIELSQDNLGTFERDSAVSLTFAGELPEDAPFTFSAIDNELVWALKIHIDIHRCPDWVHEARMLVVPEVFKSQLDL